MSNLSEAQFGEGGGQRWYHYTPEERYEADESGRYQKKAAGPWDPNRGEPVHLGTRQAAVDTGVFKQAPGTIHEFEIRGFMKNKPSSARDDENLVWPREMFEEEPPKYAATWGDQHPEFQADMEAREKYGGDIPSEREYETGRRAVELGLELGNKTREELEAVVGEHFPTREQYEHGQALYQEQLSKVKRERDKPVAGPPKPRGGFYYHNEYEDRGSVSAAVPEPSWLEHRGSTRYDPWESAGGQWSGDPLEHPDFSLSQKKRPQ